MVQVARGCTWEQSSIGSARDNRRVQHTGNCGACVPAGDGVAGDAFRLAGSSRPPHRDRVSGVLRLGSEWGTVCRYTGPHTKASQVKFRLWCIAPVVHCACGALPELSPQHDAATRRLLGKQQIADFWCGGHPLMVSTDAAPVAAASHVLVGVAAPFTIAPTSGGAAHAVAYIQSSKHCVCIVHVSCKHCVSTVYALRKHCVSTV